MDWARAFDLRQGDNPAAWSGHLEHLLPAPSQVAPVKHHAALPYADLPGFMAKLRAKEGVSARALEFTILCAVRTGDTIGAKWSEVDASHRLWTVPGARLKGEKGAGKRDHLIPLSRRACEILLEELPKEGDFIFPGGKEGAGLSNAAMSELLKGMGYSGDAATVHGFRSTFMDWGHETTAYPKEMMDIALAHTVADKVEAAYRRGDMREKRTAADGRLVRILCGEGGWRFQRRQDRRAQMKGILRDTLMIFESLKDQPSSLPQKKLLETLYRGVIAEAAGWRHLFEGHGDEASIVAWLGVIDVLNQHSKNPRGPKKQCPTPADEQVIDRYLQREKFDLNMRAFRRTGDCGRHP